jgi:glutathione S-transferase
MQRFVRPARGLATDEELVAKHLTALEVKLAGYERMLAKQRYLAGEEITLADLAHLPYGSKLASLGVTFLEDEKKFPNVAR